MATVKVFIPIFALMFLGFTIKGNHIQSKYTQTASNFPDTNVVNLISIKDAIDYVLQLTEGNVTKAEIKFKKDIPIWKADVMTGDHGIIKIELSALDKSLLKIDGEEGPFNYEIKPDVNVITFTEARIIAEKQSGQKTLKWNYFRNKNNWEYNFWLFLKSGKAQVRVNAETGEIITANKKKK